MGRFVKGQTGNPGGRPGVPKEVRELFGQHTEMAIERLAYWAKSDNPKASVSAAQYLVNRVYGMPSQVISGDDENPLTVVVKTLADLIAEQDGKTKGIK